MAKTPKYPNPAFFRTKNNMDWKAQGENLKEVFDIAKDMLLATDWKAFGARQKQGWIDFGKRVAEEAAEIAAMSCAERRELLLKGEKKLGRLSAIVTLVSGVIALILAISSSSILSLLSSTYSIMNAGALVMVLGGIFWKKGTKEGAIASALCGMAMIILNKCGVQIPYIAFTSLIPALIAYIVVSLATQPKNAEAK